MSIKRRKLADGSTVYDVRRFMGYTIDGKPDQRSRTFRTKREAEVYDSKLVAEKDAMRGRSGRITLSSYIDNHWWPVAYRRLEATSLDTYEKEVRLRIRPCLGDTDVRDIDRARIQRMVDSIPTKPVARKCVGVLKTILNHAKGDGLILANPAEAVFAMPPDGEKRDAGTVIATFEDMAGLLEAVRKNGSESVQRIAYTGLLEGLRPEERYALDWEDIDPDARTIMVHGAYVIASPRHGGRQMKRTKTEKSTRLIPMHPMFAEWLGTQKKGKGPFITGADGKRISPSTAQKRWKRFLDANPDVPRVTIENMRHSFATSYLAAGGRIEVLSKLLGHSNIGTTMSRYVRPDVNVLRDDLFDRI